MNTDNELTQKIIGAIIEVSNTLGSGFSDNVYERALMHELQIRGVRAVSQAPIAINYKGSCVGEDYADILVEDSLVLELKCVDHFANEHMAQCLNYLKASGHTLCLLVNFQKSKAEWKRIVN